MNKIQDAGKGLAAAFRADPNIRRARRWMAGLRGGLPSATADYLAEKLPAARWLPRYDYRWIVRDAIGGITVGVMLIPQGLAYAKIAKIDMVNGLYSSFLPPALYFLLGTSRELSPGPTSILGLLTAEAVTDLSREGHAPAAIASALAFTVGAYALAMGLLRLGFLLDFVSAPVLTGWISAVALVIALGQVGSLVGLDTSSSSSTTTNAADLLGTLLRHLDRVEPPTLALGLAGIALLLALEHAGRRWGSRHALVRFLATSRAVLVLVLFTLISYLANRGRAKLLWAVTRVEAHGLPPPRPVVAASNASLLRSTARRAVAPLIAMAVEHLGVGKAFALRGGYPLDKSQELVFLGVSNMANSLFGAMPTGGAMSRTAVNADCRVHSPVNFLFTSGFVLLTLYELAPALYWIPKPTLSAIIIMAVIHLVAPPRHFYLFWKTSLADFLASTLAFLTPLFTSTETGLATAVAFSIAHTLLRLAFPRWIGLSHAQAHPETRETQDTQDTHMAVLSRSPTLTSVNVPAQAFLVQYNGDIFFANAERLKNAVIQAVKVHFEPAPALAPPTTDPALDVDAEVGAGGRVDADAGVDSGARVNADADADAPSQTWNPSAARQIARIRKRMGITALRGDEAPLRRVILDFSRVSFVDTTGVFSLTELKMELRRHAGPHLEFRFVGMVDEVRERFERADWEFACPGQERRQRVDVVHSSLELALGRDDVDDVDELFEEKRLHV